MKRINILYWTFTGLFAAAMLFSSVPDIMVNEQALQIFQALHMPAYLIPFLGWAKLAGVITILVPGFPRLKEWAYAGLFIDLVGATYCSLSSFPPSPQMLGMLIFFGLGIASYYFYHKRQAELSRPVVR